MSSKIALRFARRVLAGMILLLTAQVHAHDKPLNLDELMAAFGWDMANAQITSEQVAEGLYVLFGVGGNIGVSIGPDGVLIVDDQFPQLMPKIADAIRDIGGGSVDFAINTHWHFDHAEGNLALGPGGTWLVAQENSRQMMLDDHIINLVAVKYAQQAYSEICACRRSPSTTPCSFISMGNAST